MIHARRLERAVRHALDESRHEEVLDLVDAEPRVGMQGSCLPIHEIDRQAETEKLIHFDRPRGAFDFATDAFRAPPFAAFAFATFLLTDDLRFFFFVLPAASPVSRAQNN